MRARLTLKVEAGPGMIEDAVREGCRLARALDVYVEFKGAGRKYMCMPDGNAVAFKNDGSGQDVWDGSHWTTMDS